MVWGANEDQLLGVERSQLQVRMADRPTETELHLVTKDKLHDVLRVAGAHRHLDARVCGDEFLQKLRQEVGADGRCRRNHQVAGRCRLHLFERISPFG